MLQTERVLLSNWETADLPDLVRMNLDAQVMRYFPAPYSPDESAQFLKNTRQKIAEKGFGWWKASRRSDGMFLGFVGLKQVDFEAPFVPAIEIGWRLVPEAWGQGYATEAAQACLHFAFIQLQTSEVVSFTPTTNTPSEAVMKRLGMVQDGTFMHPKVPKGHALQEHLLYRISRQAWAVNQP